MWAAIAQLV